MRNVKQVCCFAVYAGRVFTEDTEDEVEAEVASTSSSWLTIGKECDAFQRELAALLGVRHNLLVNSGSSANLIEISALTSPELPEARRIKPGDEVIMVAAGFPTTLTPIVQVGAVPVFIDADPITGNTRCDQLDAAYSAGKTKAVKWPTPSAPRSTWPPPWPSAAGTICGLALAGCLTDVALHQEIPAR